MRKSLKIRRILERKNFQFLQAVKNLRFLRHRNYKFSIATSFEPQIFVNKNLKVEEKYVIFLNIKTLKHTFCVWGMWKFSIFTAAKPSKTFENLRFSNAQTFHVCKLCFRGPKNRRFLKTSGFASMWEMKFLTVTKLSKIKDFWSRN